MTETSIEDRASFGFVRYANCWEDAALLSDALRPAPGKRILSIASAGDNSFSLLARGADVVAADLSPAQLALVELKRTAIRRLPYGELLRFLGIEPAADRLATFDRIRPHLPDRAAEFFGARPDDVRGGVIHAGKFESYFRIFRTRVLPFVHSKRTIAALLEQHTEAARREFFDRRWNTWRWRLLFRVFFSRFVMGRLGRDPEFFRYVEGSVAERIRGRADYALTELPTDTNPYLRAIFTGNFAGALPDYLAPERWDALRAGLDRLTLYEGPIDAAAGELGPFDGFNLSDIFEYLSPEICRAVYGRLLDASRPGARFAYWNMLVPRRRPEEFAARVRSLDDEAKRLFARDLAFFYSAFVLEETI